MKKITVLLIITAILFPGLTSCLSAQDVKKEGFQSDTPAQLSGQGLMGYISSSAPQPSSGYGAGIGGKPGGEDQCGLGALEACQALFQQQGSAGFAE